MVGAFLDREFISLGLQVASEAMDIYGKVPINATYIFNFDMWKIVQQKCVQMIFAKIVSIYLHVHSQARLPTPVNFVQQIGSNMTCRSLHGCEAPYLVEAWH